MVELGEKGSEPQIRRLPILCHPDVKRVRGTLEELKLLSDTMEKMPDGSGRADAYVSVVLTDEKEMYDFRERLEELFAHIWRSEWTMRGRRETTGGRTGGKRGGNAVSGICLFL